MINSPVLDTAIGLIFIFLIYSLLATSINEAIATLFSLRARTLKRGIIEGMLSDCKNNQWVWKSTLESIGSFFKELGFLIIGYKPKKKNRLGDKFYDHPIIKNYGSSDRFSIPSYIPKENFSTILIEILDEYWDKHKNNIAAYLKENNITDVVDLENLPQITKISYLVKYLQKTEKPKDDCKEEDMHIDKEILKILELYLNKSYQNIETFTAQLEKWYDDTMNRVSGWYKRQTQFILFFLGLAIAITFNVDIIDIAGKLSTDKDARDKLVEISIKSAEELKDDPRVQPKTQNPDSTAVEKDSASIADYKKEVEKVKTELNGRIKDANNLLAVGWGDYGRKKDSITYIEKYKSCFKSFKDTIRKTDSIKYFKTQALVNQYSKDTSSTGKKKLAELKKIFKEDSIQYNDTIKLNQKAFAELYKSKQYRIKASYVFSNFYKGRKPLGFLLLAFAICLGAPFWFDLLQKLIKIRAAGKKEETGDGSANSNSTSTSPPVQVTVNNNTNPRSNRIVMERYKVIVPKLNVRKAPVADFNDKSNIITTVSDGLVLDLEEYHNVPNPGLGKWYTDGKGQFYSGLGLVGEDLKVNKLVSLKYPWWIDNNLYSIPELWKENEKTKVTIALLDTGISEHEDFNFNNIIGYNYLDNSANYKTDINGHGTHLAGIMIAQGKKTYGVAPNANLFVAKVCDDSGTPNIKAVKNALLDIYNSKNGASGISIINMSFGLKTINEDEYKIKLEIESLLRQIYIEKKIILISSSGKIDDKKDSFPSTLNECISVGCLNSKFERHPFSRITKTLDIMAPGDEILSSNGINNVKKDSGTSQAAAYISSVCALILQRQKILITDPEFVKKSLFASAYSNSFPLEEYGHGIVNPNKFYTDLKN